MYWPCIANFTGSGPILTTLPISKPIGNVISLPLLFAYQFTSMFGDVPMLHPWPGKYWKKYSIFIWLVVCGPGPPTENHCWGKTPASHLSPRYPITPAGPSCHLFCPSRELLAVGKMKLGPIAKSHGPASFGLGEIIVASIVSPNPVTRWRLPLLLTYGEEFNTCNTGRVIRFQLSVSARGKTG